MVPGCGDYAVLAAVQGFLPELGLKRENIVFVSGIGCSSRFPYYLNTYGMHSIHGRAPAIATGLRQPSRPVGVGGHRRRRRAVHRRQSPHPCAAPQREPEDPAVQQPDLRPDQGPVLPHLRARQGHQVDADGLARRAVQPGVAGARRRGDLRGPDAGLRPQAPTTVLRAAAEHQGTALVEIYQNCNIFNDGAFDLLKDPETQGDWMIRLEHGQPLRFGSADGASGRHPARRHGSLAVEDGVAEGDPRSWSTTRRRGPVLRVRAVTTVPADPRYTPMGVFRDVDRPSYDQLLRPARGGQGQGARRRRRADRPAARQRHLDDRLTCADHRRGLIYGFVAYLLWGLFPLYWPLLAGRRGGDPRPPDGLVAARCSRWSWC